MINHILFPFDFSKPCFLVAPFVRAIAGRFNAKISVVTVIPPAWNTPPGGALPLTGLDSPVRELETRQEQILAKEFAGLSAERLTLAGDPAFEIITFAHHHGVDLIMMPTHGVTGYRTMLLGSVTVKVLHEANVAVWTATHAEEQRPPETPRKILCAADDSPQTIALMQWASGFAQRMDAELNFIHVAPLVNAGPEIQQEVEKGALAKLEALKQSHWIPGNLRVTAGDVAERITAQVRQENADLLLIGRGLLPSPVGRLRSNAYAIIQQSPVPVLSV